MRVTAIWMSRLGIRMKNIPLYTGIIGLLLLCLILSLFLDFSRQTPGFTILAHSPEFEFLPVLLSVVIFLIILVAIGLLSSKLTSRAFSLSFQKTFSHDLLTYLPLFLLAFFPLTLGHYLTSEDLSSRLKIFLAVILLSLAFLKFVQVRTWSKGKPAPWGKLSKKFSALSTGKKLLLLFLAAVILFNAGSWLVVSKGITFSGDEIHYLLITHSLLHDGDFDLANNYEAKDYVRYLPAASEIKSHAVPGTKPGSQYSFHSPGVALLLLPFYALGSLFGKTGLILFLRFGMSIFASLLGLQVFLYSRQEWHRERLSLTLWALFSFTSPVFFYSFHVYPEIVIALFSILLFRLIRFTPKLSSGKILLCGFLLSSFIWFHALKYIFIMAPLFLYCLWVLIKKHTNRLAWLTFLIFPVLVTSLYFFFQKSLYGSFSLAAVSWRGKMSGSESLAYLKSLITDIPLRFRLETLAGYFLDQRDGLFFYAPLYVFAFLGMIEMIRRKGRDFLLILFLAGPYIFTSAFLTQRTGYAPQARPLVAVLWVMGILLAYFLVYNTKKIFSYLFVLSGFLSFAVVYILIRNPLALYQETTFGTTERGGELFYQLSNLHFDLTRLLPSFIKVEEWRWLPNFIWPGILLAFITAYLITRKHSFSLKFRHHLILAAAGITILFFWLVFYPRITLRNPVNTSYSSGEKVVFYSLSRVARMTEPGRFEVLQDNRFYNFYFTSWRKLRRLDIEYGSTEGDYSLRVALFDHTVLEERTEREVKPAIFVSPPFYRLGNVYLYRITLYLERQSEVSTARNPYLFSIQPVS